MAQIRLKGIVVNPPPPSKWVLAITATGGVGALMSGYLAFGGEAGPTNDALLWFLGTLGLLVLGVFLLIRLRQKPRTLTMLRVVSSGTPYRALVSDDEAGLADLKRQMTEAINDLGVTYHQEFRSYDISAENYIGEIHAGGTGFVQQAG